MALARTRTIGVIGYDGVNALDLVGPAEAFTNATQGAGSPAYEILIVGLHPRPFVAESGLTFTPHCTLDTAPSLDTVIVPGGAGLRDPKIGTPVIQWLRERAAATRRIVSVCTGIYGLAPTGLLDGARVTTHWRFAADVQNRFPHLNVDSDAIYIGDGRIYTSAGITAGIDLALALIEQDLGRSVSLAVAREMLVYLQRPGGQSQFSEPLRMQVRATDRFADVVAWMASNLAGDLSVEALATRASLSPRQFHRRFLEAFGCTAAAYVQELRLAEALLLLLSDVAGTIDSIASAVGFKSADGFRRAFERRFGISPATYRQAFGATGDDAALSAT